MSDSPEFTEFDARQIRENRDLITQIRQEYLKINQRLDEGATRMDELSGRFMLVDGNLELLTTDNQRMGEVQTEIKSDVKTLIGAVDDLAKQTVELNKERDEREMEQEIKRRVKRMLWTALVTIFSAIAGLVTFWKDLVGLFKH